MKTECKDYGNGITDPAVEVTNLQNDGLITVKCHEGAVKALDSGFSSFPTHYSNYDDFNYKHLDDVNLNEIHPEIEKCVDEDAINLEKINRCDLYQKVEETYECMKCEHGYSVKINSDNTRECVSIDNCDNKINKYLPNPWNYLFSCHYCDDDDKIPVLVMNSDNLSVIDRYQFQQFEWTSNHSIAETHFTPSVQCLKLKTKQDIIDYFNVDVEKQANIVAVPNCKLAVIDLEYFDSGFDLSDANTDPSKVGMVCASCEHGYLSDSETKYVTDCKVIEKCEEGVDGACLRWEDDYVFEIDDGDFKYTTGIKIENNPNCFAAENDSGTVKCRICKNGYSLNENDVCVKLNANHCNKFQLKSMSIDSKVDTLKN